MTGGELVVVRQATGELLDRLNVDALDAQPPERLAAALDAVRDRQAELKRASDALETELRRRLKLRGRRTAVFGEWEVDAKLGRESEWDPDELEQAMAALVEEGTIAAGEVADVITRPPIVSRQAAKQLLGRLTGPARESVEAACIWREKPGKLTVVRSIELGAGDGRPTLEPPTIDPEEFPA